ncbi:MAG: hypothetical protein DGJ47_000346 [Rickettsiaceae bacterium]
MQKKQVTSRPIDRFYKCYLLDVENGKSPEYRQGINKIQFVAADRLSCNYERIFSNNSSNIIEQPIRQKVSDFRYFSMEGKVEAMRRHSFVFDKLSTHAQNIINHVCLKELTLRSFESSQLPKLQRGQGMHALRNSLDELDDIYRNYRCR